MHLHPHLLDAVARGEEPQALVDELLREHLAALCPVCAESLLSHEARLRRPGSAYREEPRDPVKRVSARLGLREVELRAHAHFNLAHHLHAAGETDRAEAELAAHEELIVAASPQLANLLVWLRAKIAWSRGELDTAERLYTEARQRALDRGIAWDAGLVSLELALVYLVRGRTDRVRELAAEALRVFSEQQVERETRASLELLEAAARRDAFTREVLEQAISAIEGAPPGRQAGGPSPA